MTCAVISSSWVHVQRAFRLNALVARKRTASAAPGGAPLLCHIYIYIVDCLFKTTIGKNNTNVLHINLYTCFINTLQDIMFDPIGTSQNLIIGAGIRGIESPFASWIRRQGIWSNTITHRIRMYGIYADKTGVYWWSILAYMAYIRIRHGLQTLGINLGRSRH